MDTLFNINRIKRQPLLFKSAIRNSTVKLNFLRTGLYAGALALAFAVTPAIADPDDILVDDADDCDTVDEANLIPDGSRPFIWVNQNSLNLGPAASVDWDLINNRFGALVGSGTALRLCGTGDYSLYAADGSTDLPAVGNKANGKAQSVTLHVYTTAGDHIGRYRFWVFD